MNKFDLEAAKNGAAVCMRDGTPVKILDFDFGGSIVYKYTNTDGKNRLVVVTQDGIHRPDPDDPGLRKCDLFMASVYAYACIYKDPMTGVLSTHYLHQTFEEAKANRIPETEDREFFCHARIEMFFKEKQEGGVNEE